MSRPLIRPIVLCSSLLIAACTEGEDPSLQTDRKAEFNDPFTKTKVKPRKCEAANRTGVPLATTVLGRLEDPIAKFIFDGKNADCVPTQRAMIAALKANPDAVKACNLDGMRTAFVTEIAQLEGKPAGMRTVTIIDCGDDNNKEPSILFSTNNKDLGDGFLEIIGRDKAAGVFNFYDSGGGEINYFGNSALFLRSPPTGPQGLARCGACHTGGGLIQKELQAPWLHWEGDTTTPGAADAQKKNKALFGDLTNGIEVESVVRGGNDFWNGNRLDILKNNTKDLPSAFNSIGGKQTLNPTQKLLEPLFCGAEVNTNTASSSGQPKDKVGGATNGPLGGPIIPSQLGFGSISFTDKTYNKALKELNSRVGSLKTSKGEPVRDTHFALPTIAQGASDFDYLDKVKAAGIIDDEFEKDVLAVDFTRALSTDRCAMLKHVDNIVKPADRTLANIKSGVINRLKGIDEGKRTPVEVELLSNLLISEDHNAKVQAFEKACQDRITADELAMVKDYLTAIEAGRDAAAARSVFETPEMLARLDGNTPLSTRLDPKTCKLTNTFTPVTEVVNRAQSCAGRCSVFEEGAACQCDSDCQERKDCCNDEKTGFVAECLVPACDPDICATDTKPKPKKGCLSAALKESEATEQTCVEKICAQDNFCCSSNFDSSCLNEVDSVCKFKCPGNDPMPKPPKPKPRRIKPDCLKICKKSNPCGKGCSKTKCTDPQKIKDTVTCDKDGNPLEGSDLAKKLSEKPQPAVDPILPQ